MVPEVGLEPTSLAAEDFLPTSAFAADLHGAGRSWSGARLHHSLSAVGARRLLSTPSLEPFGSRAWLGISSNLRSGPSPSLTGFTSRVSPRRLKFGLSPLRLPIPPLGQDAHDTSTTATTDLEPASVALTPSWLLARKASFSTGSRVPS